MVIKVKRRDLFKLSKGISISVQKIKDVKINYRLIALRMELEKEIIIFSEMTKGSESENEYRKGLDNLYKKHAVKDENGKPVSDSKMRGAWIIEETPEYLGELEKYKKDNLKMVQFTEDKEKRINEFSEEEYSFNFEMIELSSLPKDFPGGVLEMIFPLISGK